MKRLGVLLATAAAIAISILAEPEPQIGSVLRHDNAWDISVIYTEPVDIASLSNPENYTISPGTLTTLRLAATNQGVVLTATGLTPNVPSQLTITNVLDTGGNPLPNATLDFMPAARFWAAIGANELGFTPDVVGFPTNGFDVFSGGIQQQDEYDDATFVGDRINGDFEAKVRVEYVDPAGRGAKAGIMIREALDEGKSRPLNPDDPTQAFSRYLELAVSSPTSITKDVSANHQIWQRAVSPGFETLSIQPTNDVAPTFPTAWLRVTRMGQQFTMSRSVDGLHWESIGGATFDPPLATNIFVGLAFSPSNNDISPASGIERQDFVAKFRDYALTPIITDTFGVIRIQMFGDHAEVSWDGTATLETAPAVTGAWSNAPAQQSPVRVNFSEGMRFYRLRQ